MYAACRRRGTEQQVEMSRLHDQTTQLQADLAASHAAELAKVEQEHKAAVAVLHQVRCLCMSHLLSRIGALLLSCMRCITKTMQTPPI